MLCKKEARSCPTVFRVGRNGEEKKTRHLLRTRGVEVEQVKIFRFWKAVLQRVDVFQKESLAVKMEH